MKRTITILTLAFGLAATSLTLRAQTPAPAAQPGKSPLEALKAIRDANAKLLDQQTKTLQQLEEMEKTAQSIKVLGRRS